MTTTQNLPAMPALDCPSFCDRDHEARWARLVELFAQQSICDARPDELKRTLDPTHGRTYYASDKATVELTQYPGEEPKLFVEVGYAWEGEVNPETALAFAEALREAASALKAALTS